MQISPTTAAYPHKEQLAECKADFDENAWRNKNNMIAFIQSFTERHGLEPTALMLAYTVCAHYNNANYTIAVREWAKKKMLLSGPFHKAAELEKDGTLLSNSSPLLVKRAAKLVIEQERAKRREARDR